jgi:Anti-sigma-K factor rskA
MLTSAANPLNPQFHDEFVALCALYYSGETSEEEWALLQIHMAYCDSCHKRFLEYQLITSDVIPVMAAVASSELDHAPGKSAKSVKDAERELMKQLDYARSSEESPRRPKFGWRLAVALIATCVLGVAYLLGLQFVRMKTPSVAPAVRVAPGPERPRPAISDGSHRAQETVDYSKQQITALEQQVAVAQNQLKQKNLARADIEKQLEAERNAQKPLREEKERLGQQLASAQTELDSIRGKSQFAGRDADQQAAHAAALEAQARELKAALDEKEVALSEKDRMLALDKDFLAHDRDIRDLIGARNLYIADIFDTTETGKTGKQFGRIFYTKDRSLIFYGFELDSQAGNNRDVSFQVWGSSNDRPGPVSLGLFYQDGAHHRWVLRCHDSKMLARLDTVFVSVEPPGGSTKPTGKQFLRAYLHISPNHP